MGCRSASARSRERLNKGSRLSIREVGQRVEIVLSAEQAREEIEDIVEIQVEPGLNGMLAELIAQIVYKLITMLGSLAWTEIIAAERNYGPTLADVGLRVIRVGGARLAISLPLEAALIDNAVGNH